MTLAAKTTALVIAAPVLLAVVLFAVTTASLGADAARRGRDMLALDMRVAQAVLATYGDGYSKHDGRLWRGRVPLDGDFAPVDRIKALTGASATIFSEDLRVSTNVTQQGRRAVGTRLTAGPVRDAVLGRGEPYSGEADVVGQRYLVAYTPIRDARGLVVGALFTGEPKAQFYAPLRAVQLQIAPSSLAAAAALAAGAGVLTRRTFAPLAHVRTAMERLAAGDRTLETEGVDRGDDVGAMARAVEGFRQAAILKAGLEAEVAAQHQAAAAKLADVEAAYEAAGRDQAEVVRSMAEALGELAEGDLTCRVKAAFNGDYARLQRDFDAAVSHLQETMQRVGSNGHAILASAGEISKAADNLSRRTEQQAASLEQTAAALDEITATVRTTAQGSAHACGVVAGARAEAERSAEVMDRAVQTMGAIEASSQQISRILGVIDGIALQTNLLALNAGVEAARAGEAGRGFAVVAMEVRALAQKSAAAAKEIKDLIATSDREVASGVTMVADAGQALARILAQVVEINSVVGAIAASAGEQSAALAEVNVAVNQMDQVTQQNAAMVEQSTVASRALAQDAESLIGSIAQFRVGVAPAARPRAEPRARRA